MTICDDGAVLVLGGTGGVGAGIVEAWLARTDAGPIVVTSRDARKLAALRDRRRDPRLSTLVGSVADDTAAAALLAAATARGPLHAVVASLGGWWEGPPLSELAARAWHEALDDLLTPHVVAARAFLPALEHAERARYLAIGGGAALTPVPGSAMVSIAGAAQRMLVRALVAERHDRLGPIVEELLVDGPVKTNARHHGPLSEGEITAREVGDVVAAMLLDGTTGPWPGIERDGPIVTMKPRAR